jgi:hypothetical protein
MRFVMASGPTQRCSIASMLRALLERLGADPAPKARALHAKLIRNRDFAELISH